MKVLDVASGSGGVEVFGYIPEKRRENKTRRDALVDRMTCAGKKNRQAAKWTPCVGGQNEEEGRTGNSQRIYFSNHPVKEIGH